jgi:hypothetical protein
MESELDLLASHLDEFDRETEAELRVRWRSSRAEQGRILMEYQYLYRPLRLWLRFLKTINIPTKTAYRLIDDAHAVSALPKPIMKAAAKRGVDLGKRKFRPAVKYIKEQLREVPEDIDEEKAERIVTNVLIMPSPAEREQLRDDPFVPLSREEKQRFAIRMKIRTALTNIEPDLKFVELIAALEEEMFDMWGVTEPATVTITPRASGLTIDGRKRQEDVA